MDRSKFRTCDQGSFCRRPGRVESIGNGGFQLDFEWNHRGNQTSHCVQFIGKRKFGVSTFRFPIESVVKDPEPGPMCRSCRHMKHRIQPDLQLGDSCDADFFDREGEYKFKYLRV